MIECLYVGFDGLDVVFEGWLPDDELERLADAKAEAQDSRRPVLWQVGEIEGFVASAGAPGFTYRFDTGDDGEIWFFQHPKRRTATNRWQIKVSVKSLALAVHGYHRIKARIYERLEAMRATVLQERIGRVDIAADFRMDGFALDPAAFVAHSHSTKVAHPDDEIPAVHWAGRRVSSVTIGKMPGRQIICYDKRKEVIQRRKLHWFDFWGVRDWRQDKRPVWRIEVRGGKGSIRSHWRILSWTDLEAQLADYVRRALTQIRLTIVETDKNVSRWETHPLWEHALQTFMSYLKGEDLTESGVIPVRRVVGRRSTIREMYEGQIIGLVAAYAAANGLPDGELSRIQSMVSEVIAQFLKDASPAFAEKVQRAKNRLHLTEDVYDISRVRARSDWTPNKTSFEERYLEPPTPSPIPELKVTNIPPNRVNSQTNIINEKNKG